MKGGNDPAPQPGRWWSHGNTCVGPAPSSETWIQGSWMRLNTRHKVQSHTCSTFPRSMTHMFNNIRTGIQAYTHTCMHTSNHIYQLINRNIKMMCNQSKTISHDSEPQRFKQFKQFNLKQFKRSQTIHQTISNGSNNTNNLKQTRTISNNLKQSQTIQTIQTILKQPQTIQTILKLQLGQKLWNMPPDACKVQDKAMG